MRKGPVEERIYSVVAGVLALFTPWVVLGIMLLIGLVLWGLGWLLGGAPKKPQTKETDNGRKVDTYG